MKNYFDKFPDSYLESSRRRIQTPSAFARSANAGGSRPLPGVIYVSVNVRPA